MVLSEVFSKMPFKYYLNFQLNGEIKVMKDKKENIKYKSALEPTKEE